GLRQTLDVIPHVRGPTSDQLQEARPLPGEQGARRLLEAGQVAREHRHRVAHRLADAPGSLLGRLVPNGGLHEPPQGGGDARRLMFQPLPVARKQGHLPTHHPEPGTPWAGPGCGCRALDHLLHRPAEIEIDGTPALIVEDHEGRVVARIHVPLGGREHLPKGPVGDEAGAREGRVGSFVVHGPNITRVILAVNIRRVISELAPERHLRHSAAAPARHTAVPTALQRAMRRPCHTPPPPRRSGASCGARTTHRRRETPPTRSVHRSRPMPAPSQRADAPGYPPHLMIGVKTEHGTVMSRSSPPARISSQAAPTISTWSGFASTQPSGSLYTSSLPAKVTSPSPASAASTSPLRENTQLRGTCWMIEVKARASSSWLSAV